MFLLKCRVENFGTLSKLTVDFENGLSVIKEDNGFGKTTTAAFIKAMFYGFNKYTGKDLSKNERARFKPWQGGQFGGTLDFIIGNKTYRIERFFGDKEKDDTFALYNLDTDTISNDFSENIGVEIFGVDADSFEKSVFLPQQRLQSGMNSDISAKLTGLVESGDDIGNFDDAMAELKKQNTVKGVKGRLEKAQAEVFRLERQISDRNSAAEALAVLREKHNQTSAESGAVANELEALRKRITKASNIAAAKKDADRRKELLGELESVNSGLEGLSLKYKSGLPSDSEVKRAVDAVSEQTTAENRLQVIEGGEKEQERFNELSGMFKNGLPEYAEISECRTQTAKLSVLKASLDGFELKEETPEQPAKKGGKVAEKVAIAVAAVLFLAGVGLLFVNSTIGIVLLAVGIMAMGVSGFLMLKGMISANNSQASSVENELRSRKEQLESQISSCEKVIKGFFDKFGADVETVAENLNEYKKLKQFLDETLPKIAAEKQKIRALKEITEPFFLKFLGTLPEDTALALNTVREDVRRFKELTEAAANCRERLNAIPESAVEAFDEPLSVEELIAKESELASRLDLLKEQLTTVEKQKAAAQKAEDDVQELLPELEQRKSDIAELERALEIVRLTEQFLVEARDGLSTRYMTVLRSSFQKYTDKICGADVGEFMLDNELNLNLSREGKGRDRECFSEGYRDMLDICMRLALIDALYDDEKPMLILDDPFVNLDDKKVDNALVMLDELAKERQIIYLTCHSSRMPK